MYDDLMELRMFFLNRINGNVGEPLDDEDYLSIVDTLIDIHEPQDSYEY